MNELLSSMAGVYVGDGRLTMGNLECAVAAVLHPWQDREFDLSPSKWTLIVAPLLLLQARALAGSEVAAHNYHAKTRHFHKALQAMVVGEAATLGSIDGNIPWMLRLDMPGWTTLFISAGTQPEETVYHMRRRGDA